MYLIIIPTIATGCCTSRKALHHYVWEVRYRSTRIFGRIVDIGQTDTKGTNETDGFFYFIFCPRFNRHLQSRLCSYLTSFVYQQNQNTQQWQASITSHQLVSSWHGVHHITEQPPTYWVLNMSGRTKKQRGRTGRTGTCNEKLHNQHTMPESWSYMEVPEATNTVLRKTHSVIRTW